MATSTERIASVLERRIEDGSYLPGRLAPSTMDVCSEFGVSPGTAQRALKLLDARGLTTGGGQGRQRRIVDRKDSATPVEPIDYIRSALADGTIRPGSPLPSENQIMAATGFSRYAVREALAVLERSGEVVNRPGRRRQAAGKPASADARYEEVVMAIRDDIDEGRLKRGAQLQSESQLCERFDMSRVTIRRALAELEGAGVVLKNDKGRRVVA
ncbi:DNA-binding GntR family transcriptional regulator [Catenulispora sp. GP43]|uniref:GntR family transcriptional regulator n=1 Tax=Catenulispora sp. GP43 TaxID=3156263 RepID=UPI003516A2E8